MTLMRTPSTLFPYLFITFFRIFDPFCCCFTPLTISIQSPAKSHPRGHSIKMWREAAVLSLLAACAFASSGDRDPVYISCVAECLKTDSTVPLYVFSFPFFCAFLIILTRDLAVFFWTPLDVCRYDCMHEIAQRASLPDSLSPVQQYHGKWPFIRLWGIQEPASVLFSLLNLSVYIIQARPLLARMSRSHPLRFPLLIYALAGTLAWIFSSIFHIRDVSITEKLDYFSATSFSMAGLFVAIIMFFNIRSFSAQISLLLLLCLPLAYHIYYLGWVHFDYGYNMLANVVVGAITGILWVAWHMRTRRSHGAMAVAVVVAVASGMALELLDFPPIMWAVDAHALWHLWTVPCGAAWWVFWEKEVKASDVKWDSKFE